MNRENIDVESVEIKFPSEKFNKGFTLQDTPVLIQMYQHTNLTLKNLCIQVMFYFTQ